MLPLRRKPEVYSPLFDIVPPCLEVCKNMLLRDQVQGFQDNLSVLGMLLRWILVQTILCCLEQLYSSIIKFPNVSIH